MYYENFLNAVQPNMDIIPGSVSFSEMAIFTNRSIQDAYNEAVISIASNEMAIFESMIYEAELNADVQKALDPANKAKEATTEQKKSILQYIKEFFAKIWSAIKGFFANIINKIKEFFNNQKMKQMEKLLKKFDKALEYFKSNGDKNVKFGSVIDPVSAFKIFKLMLASISEGEKLGRSMLEKIENCEGSEQATEILTKEFDQHAIEQAVLSVKSGNEGKDVISVIIANMSTIDIDGSNVIQWAPKIKTIIKNVNGWIGEVKKAYNSTKKTIDALMKHAKDLTNVNTKVVKTYCNGAKKILSTLTKVIGSFNSAYKKAYQTNLKLVKKVASTAKAGGTDVSVKKESYITLGSFDTLDEGFDFLLEEDESDEVESDEVDFEDMDN